MFGFIQREASIVFYGIDKEGIVRPIRFSYKEKNKETKIDLPHDRSKWTAEDLGLTVADYPVLDRDGDCILVFRYSLLDSAKNPVCAVLPVGAEPEDPAYEAEDVNDSEITDFFFFRQTSQVTNTASTSEAGLPVIKDAAYRHIDLHIWENEGGYALSTSN